MIEKLIKPFSGVKMKLVASVLLAIAPVSVLGLPAGKPSFSKLTPFWLRNSDPDIFWVVLAVSLLAALVAWFVTERLVLRRLRTLTQAAQRLGRGELETRIGLGAGNGELGDMAKAFDGMAASLQQRVNELERERTEGQKLAALAQRLAAFVQWNPNPTLELSVDGEITYFNEAALKLARSMHKSHPRDYLPPGIAEMVRDCLDTGRSQRNVETKLDDRTLSWSFHPMLAGRVAHGYVEDTTERLGLEAQLRQAQKMESIGQLAAGVAHDFNNMLTIIQGHSSLLLSKPNLPEEIIEPIQSTYFAAERAAGLTRQLLMFSRRNPLQPKPLDLRQTIGNMTKMLTRLIGDNISLRFSAPDDLPIVLADSSMMEQIIMNLSVNARDAMPGGGVLTISLETVNRDGNHKDAHRGCFVRLRVSDTGVGMDSATLAHIFEPFFTTKEIGRGTGLGLATVYGITKQHDGWVEVASSPGQGTTFDVFFPAGNGMTLESGAQNEAAAPPVTGGKETILIVEDEPVLRELTRTILETSGYHILEAASGRDALEVWDQRTGPIDLLLTDMMMPEGVSGLELAERLLGVQPELKIIYTTGYTAHEIDTQIMTRTNANFLQKPYSYESLARLVRKSLDQTGPTATRA